MPIYLYWGNDEFAIAQAISTLQKQTLDPAWESFNLDKIPPEQPDALTQALNQAMTPPFGSGGRLVWLVNTGVCQRCPDDQLSDLERTLPVLPNTTTLLFTTPNKPDNRLKSTKLIQKVGIIQEFSQVDPWKTEVIVKNIRQTAQTLQVTLAACIWN
jgi:DNA polymerase-3 subunit delta